MRLGRYAIAAVVALVGLIIFALLADILVEWLWFSSIGYASVFRVVLSAQVLVFIAVFAISAGTIWLAGWLAHQYAGSPRVLASHGFPSGRPQFIGEPGDLMARIPWGASIAGAAVILGLVIAGSGIQQWDMALRFLHQVPFGERDPIFGKDIGFYLFSLPVYIALKNWLQLLLLCSTAISGVIYGVRGDIALAPPAPRLSPAAAVHGSVLLCLFFVLKAWSYWLDRYLLLYGDNGVVIGASYTDIHVELPVLWLLIGLAIAAAFGSLANVRLRDYRVAAVAALLVFGGSFLLALIYPALFQRFYVKPSELELEAPYIAHNIALTRRAYGLDQVTIKPFPVESPFALA